MNNPVYVISLKRDEERRQNLQRQFNRYDEFKIIDAVDAKILVSMSITAP